MANILGQIVVNLLANTSSFESGMNAATKQAKAAGKEIQSSFKDLGDSLDKIFGQFGGFAGEIGETFSRIGSAASSLLNTLGPLGGAFGKVGLGAAGIVAVGAAAGSAVLGIAAHATESAAHLLDLSQATGISVESLSLMGEVAKTKGISVDSMAKALERMDKAALQAAQSGPKSASAFSDLGIAVRNADGSMRSAQDIFNDVAEKLSKMPDGPQKTAEAMKIFGRSGAELIPLLNEGGEKLAELQNHFQKLGAEMSGDTAAASEQFQENMVLLGAGFTGVQNKLLSGLVPALDEFTSELVAGLEDSEGHMSSFVSGLVDLGKLVLNIMQAVGGVISLIGDAFKFEATEAVTLFDTLTTANEALKSGNLKGAWQAIKDGSASAAETARESWHGAVADIENTVGNIGKIWDAQAPRAKAPSSGGGAVDQKNGGNDSIQSAVLKDQAEANKALASAMRDASAAGIEQAAAIAAESQISELEAKIKQQQKSAQAAYTAELEKAIPKIQAAALETEYFKAAAGDSKELQSFTQKINEQALALEQQSNVAGEVAQKQQKNLAALDPLKTKLDEQSKVYADLVANQNVDSEKKQEALAVLEKLQSEYDAATVAVRRYNAEIQNKAFQDETNNLKEQAKEIEDKNALLLQGSAAYADIASQVDALAKKDSLTVEQQNDIKSQLEQINNLKIQQKAVEAANSATFGQQDKATELQAQMTALEQIRSEWQQQGKDITPVTLALQQVQEQYDQLLLKSNSFSNGAKAAWDQITRNTQTDAQIMYTGLTKANDGFQNNLVQMLTTGKANWASYFQSIEQYLLKSELNKLFTGTNGSGGIFGAVGNLFGIGGGSQGNSGSTALTTASTTLNTAATQLMTAATEMSSAFSTGAFADDGAFGDSGLFSDMSGDDSGSSGGLGSLFGSIFGGFMADGGDVTPGKAYVVGEKHPEIFMPGVGGSVVPTLKTGGTTVHQTVNIQTKDSDSFMRSKSQVQAELYRQSANAHSRSRQ